MFRDDSDRVKYLAGLAHYRANFAFWLLAYCLMGRLEGLMRGDRWLRLSAERLVQTLHI